MKVKRIKDAFERPFRNNATSLPYSSQPQASASTNDTTTATAPLDTTAGPSSQPTSSQTDGPSRAPREPSPVWDLELDLNASPTPTPPPEKPKDRPQRASSPKWDIEDDVDMDEDESFGQSSLL